MAAGDARPLGAPLLDGGGLELRVRPPGPRAGEAQDPQDPTPFGRSKLSQRGDLSHHHPELLSLPRFLPREVATGLDENARMLRLCRGPELVVDSASRAMELHR